jgi:hypothetical protein
MLALLHSKGVDGHRKHRLLLAAYCRTFLPVLLASERTRPVVEAAEGYADGAVSRVELQRAKRAALKAVAGKPRLDSAVRRVTHGLPKREAVEFPYFCLHSWRGSNYKRPTPSQQRLLGQLIRDIFGNPFCPLPSINLSVFQWNGGLIKRLAQQAYDQRQLPSGQLDNARLAILADALEEAGLDDDALLGHLRQPGAVHVRGCAVLDWLLRRS